MLQQGVLSLLPRLQQWLLRWLRLLQLLMPPGVLAQTLGWQR